MRLCLQDKRDVRLGLLDESQQLPLLLEAANFTRQAKGWSSGWPVRMWGERTLPCTDLQTNCRLITPYQNIQTVPKSVHLGGGGIPF